MGSYPSGTTPPAVRISSRSLSVTRPSSVGRVHTSERVNIASGEFCWYQHIAANSSRSRGRSSSRSSQFAMLALSLVIVEVWLVIAAVTEPRSG